MASHVCNSVQEAKRIENPLEMTTRELSQSQPLTKKSHLLGCQTASKLTANSAEGARFEIKLKTNKRIHFSFENVRINVKERTNIQE